MSIRKRPKARPARKAQSPKRKASSPHFPMQRMFRFDDDEAQGKVFNLRAIFRNLNAEYFNNRFPRYRIVWARKAKGRPKNQIVFGSIQEEDRIIRIHPLLDRRFVPTWFLEYVVYHEMCHAVVRDEYDPAGRRI